MAHRNLVQTPLPKMKEVDTWKNVPDIDKSDIAFRSGDIGTSSDVYEYDPNENIEISVKINIKDKND